ncbi:MAG: hypothetical protein CBE38_02245 [Gammaproteobacteria bacterium TMED278]|jgi:beta-glucanase (GH16 family)|nr:glycoside hydrolase [Gammaproteobacteria bacterium]OUX42510.1 MAG: hypothetical protein CBE38_02245 [Gammaproteobacteria bacterium TMED278]RCL35953.1 MAG: glycoside hydrolase family 16 protein [SAR86 cluster bacterium]URQ69008.1 glycoside hydrolase family 16 protein [SAR86 cluster bacterium]|tara:strand:- start:1525 stop:2511 length:987 start_codon:yes stop_codon:yes gene_type:complete
MMPKCFAYLFTFIFVFTCSGSNNKTEVILTANEIINLSNSYSYTPPMSTSKDNCVSRSNESYGSWHENFDSTLDIANWSYDEGCNDNGGGCNGNNEAQNYTENDSENLFIENGYLKIQPIFEENTGSDNVIQQYTSAKIMTKDKKIFSHPSKITVCFKVPEGTGMWPAIWMMPNSNVPWPTGGEIDLMEARGRITESNIIGSAIHFGNEWPNNKYIAQNTTSSIDNDFQNYFHSITFVWLENKIDMYLDQEEIPYFSINPYSVPLNQYSYPFNNQFYLILNVAVGGHFDNYALESDHFCIDAQCSNYPDNPDKKRLLIDWIEYIPLTN